MTQPSPDTTAPSLYGIGIHGIHIGGPNLAGRAPITFIDELQS